MYYVLVSTSCCVLTQHDVAWTGLARQGFGRVPKAAAHFKYQNMDTDYKSRVYTAPHNGRKYMATVLGLAKDGGSVYGANVTRLPKFYKMWARAWPGLLIKHQPTFINHPELMAYGLAAASYLALTDSLAYLREHNESCDYHLFLEDDALPFNFMSWPSQGLNNNLDARLDELNVLGGAALLLGGHVFQNISKADAAQVAARPLGGIIPATMAYGTYGYILECTILDVVATRIHAHLRSTAGRTACFEQVLWDALAMLQNRIIGTGGYVSVPLMVDHAHGFSATWNRTVIRSFEGNATFW